MPKVNIITIDLNKWTTQSNKAKTLITKDGKVGCSVEYICKLVKQGKLKSLKIEPLNLNLVEK